MKRLALAATIAVLLLPGVARAGSATDAALGLGAFAVFNQIISGTGIFGGLAPRPVVVAPQPVVVAPPPPVYAPRPVVVAPPPPVYVQPAPVYVYPKHPHKYYRARAYHGHGWKHDGRGYRAR